VSLKPQPVLCQFDTITAVGSRRGYRNLCLAIDIPVEAVPVAGADVGVVYPDTFFVEATEDTWPFDVRLGVKVLPAGRVVCVSFASTPKPGQAPRWVQAALAEIDLPGLTSFATGAAVAAFNGGPGVVDWKAARDGTLDAVEREEMTRAVNLQMAAMNDLRPARRQRITGSLLDEVAQVVRDAVSQGHPYRIAVQEHFADRKGPKSSTTAHRWITAAKASGKLTDADLGS
jgi:hypothetical protein